MKSLVSILLLFFVTLAYGQNAQPVFSYSPENPQIGGEISFTYNSDASSAQLKDVSSIKAQILMYHDRNAPLYAETDMKKEGAVWKGSYTVKQEDASVFLVRFKGGDKTDDNGGNVWDVILYTADGKPVKNAHVNKSLLLQYGNFYDFNRAADKDGAQKEAELEIQFYPDNVWGLSVLWGMEMKGADKEAAAAKVKKELNDTYAKNKSDQSSVSTFASWYERLGDTAMAKQVRDAALAAEPKGKFAQSQGLNAIYDEKDPDKRVTMLEKYRQDFPNVKERELDAVKSAIVRAYSTAKKYSQAIEYMEKNEIASPSLYNSVSWPLIEKGEQLEQAVSWAKKGVDLAGNVDLSKKAPYMSDDAYRNELKSVKAMVLDTYGYGLLQQGKYDLAVESFEEAYVLGKGEDNDVNTHYVSALVKARKNDKAKEIALACIGAGKSSDDMLADFQTVYVKQNGSDKGFNDLIAETRKPLLEKMRKDILASRIKDKPEIDFTLKDLSGASYTLASLKGKVVIVDFWATWCGPCKASFPHLQKVYNKYKDNANVQFLALNTWETKFKDYASKLANAKKYIEDNKYTFPVLIDEGSVIDQYEVDGIPTQFIIDKKGNIGFKNVGYEGPQMEDQMSQQIEILLNDSIGMR